MYYKQPDLLNIFELFFCTFWWAYFNNCFMFWLHRHLPAKQVLNSKQYAKGYERIIRQILGRSTSQMLVVFFILIFDLNFLNRPVPHFQIMIVYERTATMREKETQRVLSRHKKANKMFRIKCQRRPYNTEKGLSFIHQICTQYISMEKFLETSHFNSISTIIRRELH